MLTITSDMSSEGGPFRNAATRIEDVLLHFREWPQGRFTHDFAETLVNVTLGSMPSALGTHEYHILRENKHLSFHERNIPDVPVSPIERRR
jgi:hypothetical protein